ncbi:MAG: hypothetical protein QW292_13435 [Candidatus Parvarchaeota archaeon]
MNSKMCPNLRSPCQRDWKIYNEELVRREFFLDLGFRENWYDELDGMNCGKKGGQYKFPHSLMRWFIIWKQFVYYRALEGIMRKLFHMDLISKYPDFSIL